MLSQTTSRDAAAAEPKRSSYWAAPAASETHAKYSLDVFGPWAWPPSVSATSASAAW